MRYLWLPLLLVAGCATQEPTVTYRTVNIAVPVECQEEMPIRPDMPTKGLKPGEQLFVVMRAALAEISIREGYEAQLRGALANCIKPLKN